MATFTQAIDYPATESCQPRVNSSQLGGYDQRLTFGLNPLVETWSVSLGSRTLTEVRTVLQFFENQRGGSDAIGRSIDPFTWTTPFGETGQFVCKDWSAQPESLGLAAISAEFDLAYVPGMTNIALPAAPVTAFTFCPDFAGRREHKSNVRTFEFGDGYAQQFTMGLSPQRLEFQLSFVSRSNTERDAIRAYLRGCAGVTAFNWTDAVTGVTGKYVCQAWSATYNAYNNNTIQATFRQVFE
jgi:phage-related protein